MSKYMYQRGFFHSKTLVYYNRRQRKLFAVKDSFNGPTLISSAILSHVTGKWKKVPRGKYLPPLNDVMKFLKGVEYIGEY